MVENLKFYNFKKKNVKFLSGILKQPSNFTEKAVEIKNVIEFEKKIRWL